MMMSAACQSTTATSIVGRPALHVARPFCVSQPSQSVRKPQRQRQQAHQALAFSSSLTGCCTSFAGTALIPSPLLQQQSVTGSAGPRREVTSMGNKGATGPFAPLVVQARNVIGKKRFNKLRGKAISLHSQVIKDFTTQYLGADTKVGQGLIRTAKKNGERLGFLA